MQRKLCLFLFSWVSVARLDHSQFNALCLFRGAILFQLPYLAAVPAVPFDFKKRGMCWLLKWETSQSSTQSRSVKHQPFTLVTDACRPNKKKQRESEISPVLRHSCYSWNFLYINVSCSHKQPPSPSTTHLQLCIRNGEEGRRQKWPSIHFLNYFSFVQPACPSTDSNISLLFRIKWAIDLTV